MTEHDISILGRLGVSVGHKATHTMTITEMDIIRFARMSGDFSPIHINEEYASKTIFAGRIAHGFLSQALLSAAMAKLPGVVIVTSQSVRFIKPVRIGDTITALIEVVRTNDKGIVTIKQTCFNQKGEVVVDGEGDCKLYMPPY